VVIIYVTLAGIGTPARNGAARENGLPVEAAADRFTAIQPCDVKDRDAAVRMVEAIRSPFLWLRAALILRPRR